MTRRPLSLAHKRVPCTFSSCRKTAEFNLIERELPVPLCRHHLDLMVTPTSQFEPINRPAIVIPPLRLRRAV